MTGLFFNDSIDMKKAQKDLLWTQRIDTNELLTKSSVPVLNQKLGTRSQQMVAAINEVNTELTTTKATVVKSMNAMRETIGDIFNEETEDYKKMSEMGGSVVAVLQVMKESLEQLEGSSENISHIDGGEF